MTTWILFVIFFLLLAFGIPIAFVLVISTVGYAFIIGDISWALISQRMIYGINIFVMISLPFFILAGNIMASGGITKRLVACAQSFVGHVRGGLAMVDVLACMLFGTVSGSAIAGTSAVGFPLNSCHEKRRISIGLLRWTDFGGIYLLPCHTAVIGFRHICFLREGIGK